MGRRCTVWSHQTYLRFLKNGRGSGDLASYKPWITIHDFPSKGKVVRILGLKTNRIHHLLSQLEKIFFLILDNTSAVEDIKEQFPLPLAQTQMIAAGLNVKHPIVNGFSYVITTDFMYKCNGIWHAVQIKPSKELEKPRVMEKFAIEKAYYNKIGVDWKVLTEKDLPQEAAQNYYWLNSGERLDVLIPEPDRQRRIKAAFLQMYGNYAIPFHTILNVIDEDCGLRKGTAMQLFKSCIISNEIAINPLEHICLEEPRNVQNGFYQRDLI